MLEYSYKWGSTVNRSEAIIFFFLISGFSCIEVRIYMGAEKSRFSNSLNRSFERNSHIRFVISGLLYQVMIVQNYRKYGDHCERPSPNISDILQLFFCYSLFSSSFLIFAKISILRPVAFVIFFLSQIDNWTTLRCGRTTVTENYRSRRELRYPMYRFQRITTEIESLFNLSIDPSDCLAEHFVRIVVAQIWFSSHSWKKITCFRDICTSFLATIWNYDESLNTRKKSFFIFKKHFSQIIDFFSIHFFRKFLQNL